MKILHLLNPIGYPGIAVLIFALMVQKSWWVKLLEVWHESGLWYQTIQSQYVPYMNIQKTKNETESKIRERTMEKASFYKECV